ncbi:MAG: ABC transporter substrate-binding protein [Propionibacteriaceae bacterium]|jgi:NitT/TauT family transport system substrate-binding protein|nr:ABC transporter substrate-binding protein [Propionibacteriaceae bacterium]
MSQRRLAAVCAALAITLLAGCAGGGTPATTTKVNIAIQPWLGYGAWYIAQEKGFFTENGLEVTLTDFEADADMLAALAAGQVDALNVASHGALLMIEQGVDAKIVLLEDASTSADAILADPSITDVAGLKGQEVAYEEGTTSDLLLNYALSQNGMSISDITKVPLGAADAGAALIAGQVPAAVTYEPYISEAAASGNVQVIYTAGEKEGLISDVLMVGGKLISENPDAVKALAKSWGQAVDYYNSNTEDGRAIIAAGVGEEPDALATAFDGVHFFSLDDNKSQLAGEYVSSTLPTVKEVAVAAGLLDGSADPAAAVDASFVS